MFFLTDNPAAEAKSTSKPVLQYPQLCLLEKLKVVALDFRTAKLLLNLIWQVKMEDTEDDYQKHVEREAQNNCQLHWEDK